MRTKCKCSGLIARFHFALLLQSSRSSTYLGPPVVSFELPKIREVSGKEGMKRTIRSLSHSKERKPHFSSKVGSVALIKPFL